MATIEFFRRPEPSEYEPYYQQYIDLAVETDILQALENQLAEVKNILSGQPEAIFNELHDPYTWTIKQALGHVIDNERVFGYRAARIAAADSTPLPGYDQDLFVEETDYSKVTVEQLVDELEYLRKSNIALYKRIHPDHWDRSGTTDGKSVTVRAICFLLVGHVRHHTNIFRQRLAK